MTPFPGPMLADADTRAMRLLADPATRIILDRARHHVETLRVVEDALRIGEMAPEFAASDTADGHFELTRALARGPVVVTFFPGAWCPFAVRSLAALDAAFVDAGIDGRRVIALSPDRAFDTERLTRGLGLSITLASDPDLRIAGLYGLDLAMPGEFVLLCERGSLPSDGQCGPPWQLPLPATYVVDASGIVRWARVEADFAAPLLAGEVVAAFATVAARDATSQR